MFIKKLNFYLRIVSLTCQQECHLLHQINEFEACSFGTVSTDSYLFVKEEILETT